MKNMSFKSGFGCCQIELFLSLVLIVSLSCCLNDDLSGGAILPEVSIDKISYDGPELVSELPEVDVSTVDTYINFSGGVIVPEASIDDISYDIAEQVSRLPELDNSTIDTYMGYKEFADRFNQLILILDQEAGIEIPPLDSSQEGYAKISKVVTEYAPLINNYNEVLLSSKTVERGRPETLSGFQRESAEFGLEFGLVYYAAYYKAGYNVVGFLYRTSGLNRLAFKHPEAVRIILSDAHWFIRNCLVEESSKAMETILDEIDKLPI